MGTSLPRVRSQARDPGLWECNRFAVEAQRIADDESRSIRTNQVQAIIPAGRQILVDLDLALLIDNADIHCLGMQIDAAVEWVLLLVESHRGPPWMKVVEPPGDVRHTRRSPASLDRRGAGIAHTLGQPPPEAEAMMSIQRLKPTGRHPRFASFNGCLGVPGSLALAFGSGGRLHVGGIHPLKRLLHPTADNRLIAYNRGIVSCGRRAK